MKSISINSENREVKEVTLADTLNDSYALIGNHCSMVQTGEYINPTDAIMVDEEGYFKEGLCGFFYGDNFYYGNAVVWGMNPEDGDDADCSVSAEDILSKIQWVDAYTAIRIRARVMSNPFTIVSF
jgi:hypothetical protein